MDVRAHNRMAWDRQVEQGNEWTVPVGPSVIAAARQGRWEIFLTASKPVPGEWFPDLEGLDVLCLASGGGQQGPILASAGANVTVFDNSPRQLAQDRLVAERESLALTTVEGDMADLSPFDNESFDLIVHPVSNVFVPDVRPVWREAFRVLRHGGVLLSGFMNPAVYLFDFDLVERERRLQVVHTLPYSDAISLSEEERQRHADEGIPFEFSHSLQDQIGGQLDVGFVLIDLYEDAYREGADRADDVLSRHMPVFFATRAMKPPEGGRWWA